MGHHYTVHHFESVMDFLNTLPAGDKAKILAAASKMGEGDFQSPYIKTLRGPIKELIVKQYRLLFFIHENTIYSIRAFRKKSAKTPRRDIEYAERIYKMFTK